MKSRQAYRLFCAPGYPVKQDTGNTDEIKKRVSKQAP